jgi:hypothetical protein
VEDAKTEWENANAAIRAWNKRCGVENVGLLPPADYNACVTQLGPLLERQAAARARLHDLGIPITGEEQSPPSPAKQKPTTEKPPPPTTTEKPPFPAPEEINGYTDHGRVRIEGRDGHDVSDSAMQDAVKHPIGPPEYAPDEQGGNYTYVGRDATVILNKEGKVITAWANSRSGWRNP